MNPISTQAVLTCYHRQDPADVPLSRLFLRYQAKFCFVEICVQVMVKRSRDDFEEDSTLFYGEANQGISHTEFDRNTVSWLTEKYGLTYGKQMWENTLVDLLALDVMNNDLHEFDFNNHVSVVDTIMAEKSQKYALAMHESAQFWTRKFQLEWRDRQYQLLSAIFRRNAQVKLYVRSSHWASSNVVYCEHISS